MRSPCTKTLPTARKAALGRKSPQCPVCGAEMFDLSGFNVVFVDGPLGDEGFRKPKWGCSEVLGHAFIEEQILPQPQTRPRRISSDV